MASNWRTVRVFISSTFRDMHSERNHLVKVVFPALRERLEPHRVHLVDIDLRWGITEEQAENDQVLNLCLNQIDECRPFFLGLMGERYGWVPEQLLPEESRHGWTQLHPGKSVTELEILFFLRDPDFISDVPEAKRSEVQAESHKSADKLRSLKQQIREADLTIPIVENYPCRYAGLGIKWVLAKSELNEADSLALEEVASHGLVGNDEYAGLDEHLRDVVHEHSVVTLTGLEEFGRLVLDRLWTAIRNELALPESPAEESSVDPLAIERGYHERFMESRLRVYVGRESLQHELTTIAEGVGVQPTLVTGSSGSGKSAALAKFARDYEVAHPDVLLIPHFVGASPGSTGLRQMLYGFCSVLKAAFNFDDDVPPDTKSLIATFRQFVTHVPTDRHVLLVIDALNQLDESENAQQLNWLPSQFPAQFKVMVSCIDDPRREEAVLRAFTQRLHTRIDVPTLSDAERLEIVKQIPSLSAKALSPQQVQLLLSNPATKTPLFLLVALEELRGFGSFEQLNRRIEQFPRGEEAVTELFVQVIHRLQDEFDSSTVYEVLSLLASARRGLSDRELLDLIEGASVAITDSDSDLFPILRQLRPYLQHRGELRDYFHRNLFKAVDQQFLPDDAARRAAHSRLATYFAGQDYWLESVEEQRARIQRLPRTRRPANIRKLDELPWQLLQAADWQESERLLTDMTFVEATVEAGMVFDLNADYTAALDVLPELQHERTLKRQRREKLRRYGDQLVKYAAARGRGVDLPEPPDTRPTQEWMRRAETRSQDETRHLEPATRATRIQTFAHFVSSHTHLLEGFPLETLPIAVNHASGGPVVEQATRVLDSRKTVWVRREPRPAVPPRNPACVRVLQGHWDRVNAVAFTSQGHRIVSSGWDKTLRVWDVDTGECIRTLQGHTNRVCAMALTSDGHTAVSADEYTVRVWDVETGECIRTHHSKVSSIALSSDGRTAVSNILNATSTASTLCVWDVDTGDHLRTLQGHTKTVNSVALTPDGRTAVSASDDRTLRVWDVDTGDCVRTLQVHAGRVTSVTLSSDGLTAVSTLFSDRDREYALNVWNVDTGECLRTLRGHTDWANGLALAPDGHTAVSVSCDKTLRVWNVDAGECIRTLQLHHIGSASLAITPDARMAVCSDAEKSNSQRDLSVWNINSGQCLEARCGHTGCVSSLALAPDGHTAVSASYDNTLRVWDVDTGECLRTLQGHTGNVTSVVLTRDGRTAVSASEDKTLGVWDIETGKCLGTLRGHTKTVSAVALAPEGRTAVSASYDKTLRVWDIETGKCLRTLHATLGLGVVFEAVALAPDGQTAVSGCFTLRVWNVRTGECLKTLSGHRGHVNAVAMTPDGQTAISVSDGKTLEIWNVDTWECLRTLKGHTGQVYGVTFTPDGRAAISVSDDMTLRVWDIGTGTLLTVYPLEASGRSVAIATGNRIVAGTAIGQLHFLTLNIPAPTGDETFFPSVVPRQPEEWPAGVASSIPTIAATTVDPEPIVGSTDAPSEAPKTDRIQIGDHDLHRLRRSFAIGAVVGLGFVLFGRQGGVIGAALRLIASFLAGLWCPFLLLPILRAGYFIAKKWNTKPALFDLIFIGGGVLAIVMSVPIGSIVVYHFWSSLSHVFWGTLVGLTFVIIELVRQVSRRTSKKSK